MGTNDWGNQTSENQKLLGVFGDTGPQQFQDALTQPLVD